jgi:DNA-dependent RNA polymerase
MIGRRTQSVWPSEAITSPWSDPCRALLAAFRDQHVAGVNNLQRVPLTLDPVMVDLADSFAVRLMGRGGEKRRLDKIRVGYDISTARYLRDRRFWLSYHCEWRGRIMANQDLNMAREDHVRSLFRFANGKPLGKDGLFWLQVHCANCEGSTDKKSWRQRVAWCVGNRSKIEAIAAAPGPPSSFGRTPISRCSTWRRVGS